MNTKLPENSLILLEGGSLRGLYTAGALDILMEPPRPAVLWPAGGSERRQLVRLELFAE